MLATRVDGISQNLHRALQRHGKLVNDDVTTALIEHARSTIMYERQLLRELEALKPDFDAANKKFVPATTAAPRPKYIPRLEDDTKPFVAPSPSPAPREVAPREVAPKEVAPKETVPPNAVEQPKFLEPTVRQERAFTASPRLSTQSPGAGPSTPSPRQSSFTQPPESVPPLGGRFVDGTKSMFIQPVSSPIVPRGSPAPTPSSKAVVSDDPLGPLGANFSQSPASSPSKAKVPSSAFHGQDGLAKDPLGLTTPSFMSQSMRVQPSRPRLDAREAASKLANFL